MRTIERTSQFKRDYKHQTKSPNRATLNRDLAGILALLANDKPLADKHRDHSLTGDWQNHRDCHIKPDLVLIYRKPNPKVLQLIRLGSHSELSL